MTDHARGVRVAFGLTVACALWLGGCAEQGSAERLPQDSPVLVETSQTSIKMENRAGLALTDVVIVIVPFGPLEFSSRISRLEPSGKRDIPLNTFRSRDGTSFNPRFHKPKSVRISGRDTAGKPYEIDVPWS
jgi:hypothetical protein